MNNNYSVDTRKRPSIDQVKLSRSLVVLVLTILTVVVGSCAAKTGNPVMVAGFLILPFALMLMKHPAIVLVLAFTMDASGIRIPGLSFTTAGLLSKLLLIGTVFLSTAMGQRQWALGKLEERRPLKLFALVVIILMAVRGSGLRILGSSTWGGMTYVNIFIGIIFFLMVSGLRVSRKHIRWMAGGSLCLAAIGSLMQRQGWSEAAAESAVMTSRVRWVFYFAIAFLPFSLGCWSKKKKLFALGLISGAVALLLATGDRKLFIITVLVISGFGFFRNTNRGLYIAKLLIIGLFIYVFLALFARVLPLGMQRSVAVVPGISVDYSMSHDAESSTNWRLEIWRYCLKEAPKYLLIGRGSAFDVWEASGDLSSSDIGTFSPWFAFITRSYHSGPLSLLIDYGIPGLVFMLWFSGLLIKRLWGYASRLGLIDTFEARYALAFCVLLMCFIFRYFFIMGAIVEWPSFFGQYAIIIIMASSIFDSQKESNNLTAPVAG